MTGAGTSDRESVDLLIRGVGELATARGTRPLGGADLARLETRSSVAIAVTGERIVDVGDERELRRRFAPRGGGFVDAHTHPVFLGTREDEFEQRTRGASYVEIAAAGGGILHSMRGVRGASREQLLARLLVHLDRFLAAGTTTIEAKTGYGLTLADELKCLEVIAEANRLHAVDLVPTFLGAHDFPPEYRGDRAGWVELLCAELLLRVAESGLAEYADIFTESHVFDLEASRRVMSCARDLGFGLRMHVDQLTPLGGAELAAELGAASADHLEFVSEEGIAALANAHVVPVLCPVVPLYLRTEGEAPARRMVDAGLAPALSTDFNPGSCYLQSMPEVLTWAALRYRFTAAETLVAATLNAACSLARGNELGTVEEGKLADLVVLDVPNHRHLVYELGRSPVVAVFKRGRLRYERPRDSSR